MNIHTLTSAPVVVCRGWAFAPLVGLPYEYSPRNVGTELNHQIGFLRDATHQTIYNAGSSWGWSNHPSTIHRF
jgi:hypothetical protein